MGQEDDNPQTKDAAPLSNVSRGRHLRASHEATRYQARGCQSPAKGEDGDTGEPDAVKAARPVRWGVVGKGLRHGYHLECQEGLGQEAAPRRLPTRLYAARSWANADAGRSKSGVPTNNYTHRSLR